MTALTQAPRLLCTPDDGLTDASAETPVVKDVLRHLVIDVLSEDLCGPTFGDIKAAAWAKRMMVSCMLSISTDPFLGTNKGIPMKRAARPSPMYVNKVPKVRVLLEELLPAELPPRRGRTPTGYRLHFLVHDPCFLFGQGVLRALEKAREKKGAPRRRQRQRGGGAGQEWPMSDLEAWGRLLSVYSQDEDLREGFDCIEDAFVTIEKFDNPACPDAVLSAERAMPRSMGKVDARQCEPENYLLEARSNSGVGRQSVGRVQWESDGEGTAVDGGGGAGPSGEPREEDEEPFTVVFPRVGFVRRISGCFLDPTNLFLCRRPSFENGFAGVSSSQRSSRPLYATDGGRPDENEKADRDKLWFAETERMLLSRTTNGPSRDETETNILDVDFIERLRRWASDERRRLVSRHGEDPDLLLDKRAELDDEVFARFEDYFLNVVDDPVKAEGMKIYCRYYNSLIEEHSTPCVDVFKSDLGLSVWGNLCAYVRKTLEQMTVVSGHRMIESLFWLCMDHCRHAYGEGSIHTHVMVPGDPEMSKSFGLQMMALMVPKDIVENRSHISHQARNVPMTNKNYLIVGSDEASLSHMGLDKSGRPVPADPEEKERLSESVSTVMRYGTTPDGEQKCWKFSVPNIGCELMLTNEPLQNVTPALRSRHIIVPSSRGVRADDDLPRDDVITSMEDKDPDNQQFMLGVTRRIYLMIFITEMLIALELVPNVNMRVADSCLRRMWKQHTRRSKMKVRERDRARVRNCVRSMAIAGAVFAMLFSEASGHIKKLPWTLSLMRRIGPLLVATREQVIYAFTLLSSVFEQSEVTGMLRGAAEAQRNLPSDFTRKDANVVYAPDGVPATRQYNRFHYVCLDGSKSDMVDGVLSRIGSSERRPCRAVLLDHLDRLEETRMEVRRRSADGTELADDPDGAVAGTDEIPVIICLKDASSRRTTHVLVAQNALRPSDDLDTDQLAVVKEALVSNCYVPRKLILGSEYRCPAERPRREDGTSRSPHPATARRRSDEDLDGEEGRPTHQLAARRSGDGRRSAEKTYPQFHQILRIAPAGQEPADGEIALPGRIDVERNKRTIGKADMALCYNNLNPPTEHALRHENEAAVFIYDKRNDLETVCFLEQMEACGLEADRRASWIPRNLEESVKRFYDALSPQALQAMNIHHVDYPAENVSELRERNRATIEARKNPGDPLLRRAKPLRRRRRAAACPPQAHPIGHEIVPPSDYVSADRRAKRPRTDGWPARTPGVD
jgi:hypothetical protein